MNPLAVNDSKKARMSHSFPVSKAALSEAASTEAASTEAASTEAASTEVRPAPTMWVGIDVAKATLDLHVRPSGLACQVGNDAAGHRAILKQLPTPGECLIVLEATGGYERALVAELLEAGQHVAVMNPKRVRDFANAVGTLAKTDRLDAKVLALFAEKIAPPTAVKPRENQAALQELVNRRRQLIDLRTVEKNRLQTTLSPLSQRSIKAVLRLLDKQVDHIEIEIEKLVEGDDHWRNQAELIRSIPGLGTISTATLVADLPEIGTLNREKIALLAGLAPLNNDSGKSQGKRSIKGGRQSIRNVLYMAAITAKKHNPAIKAFAARLEKQGKEFKVVITACMRKLLTIANALVKSGQPWTDKLARANA